MNNTILIYPNFIAQVSLKKRSLFGFNDIHILFLLTPSLKIIKISNPQKIKFLYNENDFYDMHVDHHYQGVGQYPRKLSFTMQLSEPSEYEGGDVMLITSQNPFAIPKERGTITFFPSYTLHEVKPITKGTRKALVGWIHGPRLK